MAANLEGEFEFLSDLCHVLAEKSELAPILDWLVQRTAQLLDTDDCSIRLVTPGDASVLTVVTRGRNAEVEAGSQSWSRPLKDSVFGYLLGRGGELATPDLASDERFPGLKGHAANVRALLAVPLKVDGRVTGMLAASERTAGRKWRKQDLQLLSIVASHTAGVIEKARLRVEEESKRILQLERDAMEKELAVAHDIQMGLVPRDPLTLGAWQIEGRMVPAQHVGGDFFDYFMLGADRAALVIADVTGKGVPAALLVSTVQSALRAFLEIGLGPLEAVRQLNRTVLRSTSSGKFVTLFYAELDHRENRISYVNAGHMYPRLRRADGSMEQLDRGGMPLGLFDTADYEKVDITIGPDDALLMFSDGITDAVDALKVDFGEDRLDALWRQHGSESSTSALDRLMADVAAHRRHAKQADDETALAISPRR